jgi:hypothetical protein
MDLARGDRVGDLRHATLVERAALSFLGEARAKRRKVAMQRGFDGARGGARSDEEGGEDGPLHGELERLIDGLGSH